MLTIPPANNKGNMILRKLFYVNYETKNPKKECVWVAHNNLDGEVLYQIGTHLYSRLVGSVVEKVTFHSINSNIRRHYMLSSNVAQNHYRRAD